MPHATVHGGPTNTPGEPDPVDENGELVVADSAEPDVEESAEEETTDDDAPKRRTRK